jgi:alpha-glucosidase
MADFGYDISDYRSVDPVFGSMADLDRVIAEAHARDIRVLLDLVPNHTSDEHPWFIESRSSRDSPKRDWYLWADPAAGGGPPNNWQSVFGGPAWELDARTGQYYYHAFLRQQPDLNWRNPDVRTAMYDVLRFWLDRGVDGFRVDVLWHLIKDDQLRDNPPNPNAGGQRRRPYDSLLPEFTADRPEVHAVIAEMRRVMDAYPGRVLIGEIYLPPRRLVAYYGVEAAPEAHFPFNFLLLNVPWQADVVSEAILGYEAALPPHGWPNWVLGNHDRSRVATRVGARQARVAAMLLLTLRGTPTLYYGDEIGMTDVALAADAQRDPARLRGSGIGRDPARTPMRWDPGPGAGFSTGTPWLPLGTDSHSVNVATQREDPHSILQLHRRLIALRRSEPALVDGAWSPLAAEQGVVAYERASSDRRFLVLLNFQGGPATVRLASIGAARIVLSTALDRDGELATDQVRLRGDEGLVLAVEA